MEPNWTKPIIPLQGIKNDQKLNIFVQNKIWYERQVQQLLITIHMINACVNTTFSRAQFTVAKINAWIEFEDFSLLEKRKRCWLWPAWIELRIKCSEYARITFISFFRSGFFLSHSLSFYSFVFFFRCLLWTESPINIVTQRKHKNGDNSNARNLIQAEVDEKKKIKVKLFLFLWLLLLAVNENSKSVRALNLPMDEKERPNAERKRLFCEVYKYRFY